MCHSHGLASGNRGSLARFGEWKSWVTRTVWRVEIVGHSHGLASGNRGSLARFGEWNFHLHAINQTLHCHRLIF